MYEGLAYFSFQKQPPTLKYTITRFVLILLIGCSQRSTDHPLFEYYPSENVFEDGFVSKYYYHFYPNNPDRNAGTEIGYTKYTKLDANHYKTENYNAGMELVSDRYYTVKGDSVVLARGRGIDRGDPTDTLALNLLNKTLSVWEGQMNQPYQVQYSYNDQEYIYSELQLSVNDTTILDKPAKVFLSEWNYREVGSDSLFNKGTSQTYFVKGLGFYGSHSKGPDYSRHVELIEQMSVEEFEKRANHGVYRTGYIHPEQTISDDSEFQLCGHIKRVADYYNSTPRGEYLLGKRALMDTIYSNVDTSKLFGQSGFLVFRFVVNCEGKAGRFIAEGYDLNYQPMEFEEETVDHLFRILQRLEEWRPVVIADEARDAYFYINLKIQNGEITDILP